MSARISHLSLEYVRVSVDATREGVAYDPSSDPVELAFLVGGAVPGDSDWLAAEWELVGGFAFARLLVGPGGGHVLPVGTYSVWVKVTDDPEVPVKRAGVVVVT
jgi:hypothetical protein